MLPELQLTKDHSHTLYVPELDETYHSRNGAIEEALYVYIGRGMQDAVHRSLPIVIGITDHGKTSNEDSPTSNLHLPISILEIGFGTGLNAWLTAMECEKLNIQCSYHSLETLPLPVELTQQLNYTQNHSEAQQQLFTHLHTAAWNEPVSIHPGFTLYKQQVALQIFEPQQSFDIIYFDAFAPEKQPELWTRELFQKLYDCLNPNGVIVTYSSKGDIKRLWREIGFEVERLPGPPMKRHMLRGRKK